MRKGIIFTLILFSVIGLADATYLTVKHFDDEPVVCEIGGFVFGSGSCESVTRSEYATIGSVPVALAGAVYYFIVLIFSSALLTSYSRKILVGVINITAVGFVASVWFVYLQLSVIHAICFYCMASALSTTVLFITSLLALKKYPRQELQESMVQQ